MGVTPIYNISYPDGTTRVIDLPTALHDEAYSVEAALTAFGMPPVISGTPVVAASATARDAHWGTPTTSAGRLALQNLGAQTIRTDKGWIEQYFAGLTDGGSNPQGQTPAGWYPVAGKLPIVIYSAAAAVPITTSEVLVTGMTTVVKANTAAWTLAAGVFTCVQSGTYDVKASVLPSGASTGAMVARIKKNGTEIFEGAGGSVSGSFNNLAFASEPIPFVTGDTLGLYVFGSAANAGQVNAFANRIALRYIGPTP